MNAALQAVLKNPPINSKNQNTKVCFDGLHGSSAEVATVYHFLHFFIQKVSVNSSNAPSVISAPIIYFFVISVNIKFNGYCVLKVTMVTLQMWAAG